ncbi:glutamate racemase [Oscillospiraceae bacterium MB08-C2-2]|nr:glutamate racemase [Oscillospiraceae bacterium MB08-C2-2]
MDSRPIGVFDSGVGGLTAVKELQKLLPSEEIVYLGDTGRVPYGTRSRETIIRYAKQDIAYLRRQDVKLLVVACGTVSSNLDEAHLEEIGLAIPWTGVVVPATRTACRTTRNGRVGLIATPATVRSGAYEKNARQIAPEIQVISQACPLLVPLAENGLVEKDNPISRLTLEMYLKPLAQADIDTLILGCTHYPLFYEAIAEIMGPAVTLIDSGAEAARETRRLLEQHDLLTSRKEEGTARYCVTDTVERFAEVAAIFLGKNVLGQVKFVQLEENTGD